MKYIKKFENTIEDTQPPLKKYIIYYSKEQLPTFQLIEILSTSIKESKIKFHYQSNKDNIEKSPKEPYTTITNVLIKNSKYQSDNLEDCLDKLKLIIHTTKYNL